MNETLHRKVGRNSEEDAELSAALGWPGGISEPLLDRAALLRMISALRADAERYRWLRTARDWGFWCCHEKDGEGGQILKFGADLDAAIDAAMAPAK